MRKISDLGNPPSPNGKEVVVPATRAAWRDWLAANHGRNEGLWVVYRKASSPLEGPLYEDLVEEALCFGWIDSLTKRVDEDRTIQWYSPRRKGGLWSQINKQRIERLAGAGLMTERGQAVIDAAKADGSWSQGDAADALIIPSDLQKQLDASPRALTAYNALPSSIKKQHLWTVYSAKQPATRARRIASLVEQLEQLT